MVLFTIILIKAMFCFGAYFIIVSIGNNRWKRTYSILINEDMKDKLHVGEYNITHLLFFSIV